MCLLAGINTMIENLSSFLTDYGYISLFTASFLAATILPLGSETLVAALVYQGFNPFTIVLVATLGNYLGSCTTYYIGLKGRPALEKYLSASREKLDKSEKLFNKYGIYILLFTWIPGIGDAINMIGGLMRVPFISFSVLVILGKFGRYFAVAYLTAFFNN